MCGIFGAVGCEVSQPALQHVLTILKHRGPDGQGLFVDGTAQLSLAHTRLAVIDLVTGAQPLQSADGNVIVICNGEIYDFERLRTSLESEGCHFATKSDSEVIVHLYAKHGLNCFERLRGEFAFLLYDRARKKLIAARDRFGIKPLYFSKLENGFIFASEMKAIFASGLVKPALNAPGLDPLLELDPGDAEFPFEGIKQVPPASYMVVDLDNYESKVVHYWSPQMPDTSAKPIETPLEEIAEKKAGIVLSELEEAVRLRLRADVPVGLYLSGGVDSAFVGALMKRNCASALHSFSISFAGSERNEQQFTRQSAEFLGTIHHELEISKAMLWENLEATVWSTELPFATLAPIGKFLLSQEARKHVTVVLNGQGADEVFLGYRSFFQNAIDQTRGFTGTGPDSGVRLRRLKLSSLSPRTVQRLSLLLFHRSQRPEIARARARSSASDASARPLINVVQEARIAEMPIDILGLLGDRVEMAHSLEVRVPYLDHKLYDAAKEIPVDLKLRSGLEKAVLRDAAKDVLPDEIRMRRKLGFMLTSNKIDFFGADRAATAKFAPLLSREMFDRARIFSWRAYLLLALLARLPLSGRVRAIKRLRRNANKIVMHILQTHLLYQMYVVEARWAQPHSTASGVRQEPIPVPEFV